MRIAAFRVENFRNIKLAECPNVPDFVVVCGGNGSGKSALLQALMTAKEGGWGYGQFSFDDRAVSADSDLSLLSLKIELTPEETAFAVKRFGGLCSGAGEIEVRLPKGQKRASVTKNTLGSGSGLLNYYSTREGHTAGFFDYIEAYRQLPKQTLTSWNSGTLSDEQTKQTLSASSTTKFSNTKTYLAGLVMRDLQELQRTSSLGTPVVADSVKPIRDFFDSFFAPMKFKEVLIHTSPFRYIVETPRGEIDIDDLSAGEKEILSTFIRFHQLQPKHAIILFDEADAHLHPDLERRYLEVLKEVGKGNQVWLTTHSPEMMIAAGSDSLFTVLREPSVAVPNQFQRVTTTQQLHTALSEMMGSRGLISFNKRIVFIEGTDASADREVYEKLYPPNVHNISFVPAGNSSTVRKTAERVNDLLTMASGFQHFYSIVDGDLKRASAAPANAGGRLFHLPVYHVENFLLDSANILDATKEMLASKCPYGSLAEVTNELKAIILDPIHLKPYAAAVLDSEVAERANQAYADAYQGASSGSAGVGAVTFADAETEARATLSQAIADGTWPARCKGRDVLKGYCGRNGLKYEHFRNLLIAKMKTPPTGLDDIIKQILA
jgi:predicted ATPase